MQSNDLLPYALLGIEKSIEMEKARLVTGHKRIAFLQSELVKHKPVRRRSKITPAGRKKLSDSMKKRHKMMLAAKMKKRGKSRASA